MTTILDGKKIQEIIVLKLKKKIGLAHNKPALVIIQIGNLKESTMYVDKKKILGKKIGARVIHTIYPINTAQKKIVADIQAHNTDSKIHGIMIQLPIPKTYSTQTLLDAIIPEKDVDGLTSKNTKLLFINKEYFLPATTRGILTLLKDYKIPIKGKKVVIVGASQLVGKPTALAFLNRKATVTICTLHTKNLAKETRQAEILIVATGHTQLITPEHVSGGQILIDVGITISENKKITGDVAYAVVKPIVKAITPVPGGVGPMTVVSLFENLLDAWRNKF